MNDFDAMMTMSDMMDDDMEMAMMQYEAAQVEFDRNFDLLDEMEKAAK